MTRMVVDLPAPFGPTKPVTCPGRTVKVIPSSATVEPNRLRRPLTSIEACMSGTVENTGPGGRHAGEPSSASLTRGTLFAGPATTMTYVGTAKIDAGAAE